MWKKISFLLIVLLLSSFANALAPTISISTDVIEVQAGGKLTVSVTGKDDKGISSLWWQGDATGISELDILKQSPCTINPCTLKWPVTIPSTAKAGTYVFKANGYDTEKVQGIEAYTKISIKAASTSTTSTTTDGPPTVTITTNKSTVNVGESFTLTVSGTDDVGLANIWWYGDNTPDTNLNKANMYSCNGLKTCSFTTTISTQKTGTFKFGASARDTLYGTSAGLGQPHQASENTGTGGGIQFVTVTVNKSTTSTTLGANCSNGVKDYDELGVDCGGAYCKACTVIVDLNKRSTTTVDSNETDLNEVTGKDLPPSVTIYIDKKEVSVGGEFTVTVKASDDKELTKIYWKASRILDRQLNLGETFNCVGKTECSFSSTVSTNLTGEPLFEATAIDSSQQKATAQETIVVVKTTEQPVTRVPPKPESEAPVTTCSEGVTGICKNNSWNPIQDLIEYCSSIIKSVEKVVEKEVCEEGEIKCNPKGRVAFECLKGKWEKSSDYGKTCELFREEKCLPGKVVCSKDKFFILCGEDGRWGTPIKRGFENYCEAEKVLERTGKIISPRRVATPQTPAQAFVVEVVRGILGIFGLGKEIIEEQPLPTDQNQSVDENQLIETPLREERGNLRVYLNEEFQAGVLVLHELKAQIPVSRASDGSVNPSGQAEVTARIEYNPIAENDFPEWWLNVSQGNNDRRNVRVALYNEAGERDVSWILINATPVDVNAAEGQELSEIISLRAESIERQEGQGTTTVSAPTENETEVEEEVETPSEPETGTPANAGNETETPSPSTGTASSQAASTVISLENNKNYNWFSWPEPIQLRAEAVGDSNIDLVEQYVKRLSDNYYWDESIQEGTYYVGGWVPRELIKRFDYTRDTRVRRTFWNLRIDENKMSTGNYVIATRARNKVGVYSDWNSINFSFEVIPRRSVYFTNPVQGQELVTGSTFNIRGVCLDREDLAGGYGCYSYQHCGAPNHADISYKDANAPDNFDSWQTIRSQSQYDPIENRFYINGSCDYNWRITQGTSCRNSVCNPIFDVNKTYNLKLGMTPRCSAGERCQPGESDTINIRFRNP